MSMGSSHVLSVLVVDDDTIFHFITQRMLIRLGIMTEFIQTALSGKEAIDRIHEFMKLSIPLPDIILLDLNMPMMNGFEFLEAFKKLPDHDLGKTRIVIISSSLNDRDFDRAMQLGANQYLSKPVDENALKAILTQ